MLFGKTINGVVVTGFRVPDKMAEEIVLEGRKFRPVLIKDKFGDLDIVYVSGNKYLEFGISGRSIDIRVLDFPEDWVIITDRIDFVREVLDNIMMAQKEFNRRVSSYILSRINWPEDIVYGPFKVEIEKWKDHVVGNFYWRIVVKIGDRVVYLNNYFTMNDRVLFRKFKRDFPGVNVTKDDLVMVRKIIDELSKSVSDMIKELKKELAHEIAEKYGVEVFLS